MTAKSFGLHPRMSLLHDELRKACFNVLHPRPYFFYASCDVWGSASRAIPITSTNGEYVEAYCMANTHLNEKYPRNGTNTL